MLIQRNHGEKQRKKLGTIRNMMMQKILGKSENEIQIGVAKEL